MNLKTKFSHYLSFPEILNLYWHMVAKDVLVNEQSSLWMTGRVGKPRSRFVNVHLGERELAKVSRHIAETLQLDEAEYYSCHSLRRTSVNHMAAAGASSETLRRKVNFHNFP